MVFAALVPTDDTFTAQDPVSLTELLQNDATNLTNIVITPFH